MKNKVLVAKLGRSIGLKGDLRVFIESDFPEVLQTNQKLITNKNKILTIEKINYSNSTIKFYEIDSVDEAKKLTNSLLYMSLEDTKKNCKLKEDEYFWFDLIGLEAYENNEFLGKIINIQRLPSADYLEIETNQNLNLDMKKIPKSFLIPYIDNFIEKVDITDKKIYLINAIDIILAS